MALLHSQIDNPLLLAPYDKFFHQPQTNNYQYKAYEGLFLRFYQYPNKESFNLLFLFFLNF